MQTRALSQCATGRKNFDRSWHLKEPRLLSEAQWQPPYLPSAPPVFASNSRRGDWSGDGPKLASEAAGRLPQGRDVHPRASQLPPTAIFGGVKSVGPDWWKVAPVPAGLAK